MCVGVGEREREKIVKAVDVFYSGVGDGAAVFKGVGERILETCDT